MCKQCDFRHLHVHTEYSTLDGMSKVKELIKTAKSFGMDSIAITDHGSMSGLWEAQKVGDEEGVKVIHGCEFYYERENDGLNGHLLVLAKNNTGLENLFALQKYSYTKNFYKKPRIDWDTLKKHSEGLIVTTACLASTFNQYLLEGEYYKAKEWARKFHAVFKDDFFIELQPNSVAEQYIANQGSIRIAEELGIDIVATNDVHYTLESDCFPHEVLLAMQVKKKMSDEKRFKFPAEDFWLKTEEEMYETFDGIPTEIAEKAIKNTKVIANKCNARISKGHYLPEYYDVPEGETERSLLAKEIMNGAKERSFSRNKDYMQDTQHELDVIDRNGYSGYFLIVQDFVTSAKDRGEIVGDGRGSGAGSKVAYLTRITEIEPSKYDLLFERFMADGREPDFDVDFSDQQAVFRDLQAKYGKDSVARIVAFGRMAPKAVIRKVLATFSHPAHIISQITKLVPDLCKSLENAYKASPQLLEWKKKYKREWEVIERLESVVSHLSQHAGGVLIYPDIAKHIPVFYDRDLDILVSGWDKYMVEDLGHFKFDVLGLETLPVVHRTLESIKHSTGKQISLAELDYEDKGVYDMLCAGDVSGVFQIANQAQKVMEQQPRSFRDLIAINALIRPGVGDWHEYLERRKGKEWSVYPPRMPYMEETVGTMTYQEQFLLDAHHLAGWTIAYADKHIRKNKDIRNDGELKSQFIRDCVARGHDADVVTQVWAEIEDAVDGGYSFNKSHSASYAMLSFQTAWLKNYYPEHFYASLMSGEKTDGDGQDAISGYIAEAKKRGIKILPPDINNSGDTFVVANGGINYRITTITHVGESAIKHINELRPISSFQDFLGRRDRSCAKKNVVINLIKAGAFDFDNPKREELLWEFDMSQRKKTDIKNGVETPRYEVDDLTYMEWEKEVLGMYLSSHPMEKYGFKSLDDYANGSQAMQGGEVYDVREFLDKKANKMAFVHINTLYGNVKLVIFSRTWASLDLQLACKVGNIIMAKGKKDGDSILVNSVEVL